ncbi:MAG: 5' nucleotidase, NT5C type [Nitrososphaera sp.]
MTDSATDGVSRSAIDEARTIAIDVDSVLADVMVIWTDEYSKRTKRATSKKDIQQWDIPTILPISPDDVYRYFSYVWMHRWREIPPTEPNIGKVTERIHRKGYRVSVITKRERPTAPYVANWLDLHQVYADELMFVFDSFPKARHHFDILIDDAPKNLMDVISPKSAILFNQPWNRNFDWPMRVNTLSEAEKLL